MSTYSNSEIFGTLTLRRDKNKLQCWTEIPILFSRYIQQIKRTIGHCEYLRVLESHRDGFPHLHFHLRFTPPIHIRDRDIFLKENYRDKFKRPWNRYGHSDFQCCKVSGTRTIQYTVKYVSKSTSSSTLWSRILTPTTLRENETSDLGYPIRHDRGNNVWKYLLVPDMQKLTYCTLKEKKIKLLAWSRGYIETFKET